MKEENANLSNSTVGEILPKGSPTAKNYESQPKKGLNSIIQYDSNKQVLICGGLHQL